MFVRAHLSVIEGYYLYWQLQGLKIKFEGYVINIALVIFLIIYSICIFIYTLPKKQKDIMYFKNNGRFIKNDMSFFRAYLINFFFFLL